MDDESTDRIFDIVSRYTDRIIIRKMDIEGRQRNFAYAQAKNLWVLILDVDEVTTEELKEEINGVLSRYLQYNGFTIAGKTLLVIT